jgi:sugar phosphate isomerase/epimerase
VTLHLSPGPREPDERRQVFLDSVDRAAQLQDRTGRVACVSVDPGWQPGAVITYDPEWTLEALRRIRTVFGERPVRTAVENWKINPEDGEFVRLADALGGDRLGVLLDLGHLHVMNDDAVGAAGRIPLDIYEVHVSDNNGSSDDHLPLGKGTLPIEGIAAQLTRRGFDGVWTLEMRPDYHMDRICISRKRSRQNIIGTREALEKAISLAEAGCR